MRRSNGMVWIAGLAALAVAGGPAAALTPSAMPAGPSWVLPVMDQENLSVEEDLEPSQVPEAMKESGEGMAPAPERSEAGGNIEDEEIKRDLETGD